MGMGGGLGPAPEAAPARYHTGFTKTRLGQARGGETWILMTTGQTLSNNATREKAGNGRAKLFMANRVFK